MWWPHSSPPSDGEHALSGASVVILGFGEARGQSDTPGLRLADVDQILKARLRPLLLVGTSTDYLPASSEWRAFVSATGQSEVANLRSLAHAGSVVGRSVLTTTSSHLIAAHPTGRSHCPPADARGGAAVDSRMTSASKHDRRPLR